MFRTIREREFTFSLHNRTFSLSKLYRNSFLNLHDLYLGGVCGHQPVLPQNFFMFLLLRKFRKINLVHPSQKSCWSIFNIYKYFEDFSFTIKYKSPLFYFSAKKIKYNKALEVQCKAIGVAVMMAITPTDSNIISKSPLWYSF